MLFRNFNYFSKEAWISIKRGGMMSFVATSTIAVSLFILGIFLIIFLNLYNLLGTLNSKLDIVAYVNTQISKNDLDILNMTIAGLPGVKKVEFVSKEAAWQEFKEKYSNMQIEEYVDKNPLPDSFNVEVKDLTYTNVVAKKLSALGGIDDVRSGGDLAERVAAFIKITSMVGSLIVFLLVGSTLMIVVNTIRLTVIARENEINIMSLVGATKNFIKYPFIFEGIYIGIIGASIALTGLKVGYDVAVISIEKHIPFLPININGHEANYILLVVFATGVFLGWLGGYVSVSKSLKSE